MEHWIDLLLPLAILGGIAFGFSSGLFTQVRWFLGLLLGTVIGVWLSTGIQNFIDRNMVVSDPKFAHGVAFLFMEVIGVVVAGVALESLLSSLLATTGAHGRHIVFQLIGALVGAVNAVLVVTLVVLASHVTLAGGMGGWSVAEALRQGTDASLSGKALLSVGRLVYSVLGRFMPAGIPEVFHV